LQVKQSGQKYRVTQPVGMTQRRKAQQAGYCDSWWAKGTDC